MNKINIDLAFTGLSFGMFGIVFDFVLKQYLYDIFGGVKMLPSGASILVDLFGPILYTVGIIFVFGALVINFDNKESNWNAKEEVKKYLEKKE